MATGDLLDIVSTAMIELGLQAPTVVVGNADPQVQQVYYLVNRAGRELQQNYDWTTLQTQLVIQIGAPVVTTGNTTVNSGIVTGIPSTAAITASTFVASGNDIPVAARVTSVDSGTQVTLDSYATGTQTGVALTFAKDTYPFPTDFDRFINRTGWDRTNRWELLGPDSPQIDQWHRSGVVTVGPRRHFRQIGGLPNALRFWPPPAVLDTPFELATEYITKNWAQSVAGVGKASMTLDTDTTLIDYQAVILDTKWRYFQIKQFDYAPLQQEAIDYLQRRYGMDGGARTLSLAGVDAPYLITSQNVQDGYYPSGT